MSTSHTIHRVVMLLAALSLTLNGPLASITAQGVPTEPTATPNADLAPMPVQGTAVAPTPMPVPEVLATEARAPEYAPGVVLVGVSSTGNKGGASPIDVMLAQVGGVRAEKLYTMGSDGAAARGESAGATVVYRATLPQGADVLAAVETLQKGGVVFAEPDYLARAIPVERGQGNPERGQVVAATPNDPLYADQWGLTKIKAATAWNVVTGTPGTVIAIIDSGIDRQHPDLASRLWVNPGEIPNNGIDDDNNGYVDDVHGWNFVAKSNDVADVNGHGTQVAGVAAAAGNNGEGIAGVCWDCRIMVVKAMQASGVANYSDIAAAVNYAVAKGARVINLSLGGYADSTALRTAIQTAAGSAVIVAGAGNDSTANRFYPAAYANVLGVAATTSTNTKVGLSNYGDWVSLAAPGEAITTTFLGSDYGPGSGTSLASPFVAGLAGLIRSQRSAWSPALVRLQLLQTASALGGGGLGRGLPDASKAVQDPQPLLNLTSYTINGDANGRPTAGDAVAVVVNVSNQWLDAADVQATLSTTSTYATIGAGSASVGDIASGDVKASGVLTFRVASNAGYGRAIPLTVRLTANGGSYVRSFPIAVTTRSSEEPVCGTIVNEDDLSQTELLWTSDKTYVATCDINVPAGYTLTIQPGTRVQFAGNYAFNIGGTLIADGDGSAPIRFEAKMAGAGWTGLYYRETAADALVTNQGVYLGGNILRGVQIRGATSGIRCEATTLFLSQVTTDGGGMDCTTGASSKMSSASLSSATLQNSKLL
ncbi:MAG: S8 family serine peptidase, partial [Chloroflexi bacterium]|nr:S8 family serine peptidase [Chloroflexota bacterium]